MENQRNHTPRIEALQQQIARLETGRRRHDEDPSVGSGCSPLDRILPERGFRRGTLVEWLADGEGTGVETLAMATAAEACRDGRALVVLDRQRQFHPPAAVRLGIELPNLIVVHAAGNADNEWALDQALRCPGVAAVVAWPEKLDGRTFRRLQLAAEEGGGLGLLIRPLAARQEPSWAEVRLLVEPLPAGALTPGPLTPGLLTPGALPTRNRRLRIHLLRCHHGPGGRSVEVEIDDETHTMHLAARLADPAAYRHAAGA